jgi:competence protein ComEA
MMATFMSSVFQWSTRRQSVSLVAALAIFAGSARAQLPDGAGKAETVKLCSGCHELERSLSLRQDRAGWESTVEKMESLGAEASDQEFKAVIDYLSANYAGVQLAKLNVNKATAIEFEARLSLKRSEAAAVIAYRGKNGPFKSADDLKKVPGIDAAKIEAKKNQLIF